MKKKRKKNEDELNFWQPAADMFSALMLILMLVILLLGLYLVHLPNHDDIDPWAGDATGNLTGTPYPSLTPSAGDEDGDDGEGGGSPTTQPTVTPTPTLTPSPTPTPTPVAGAGGHEGPGEDPGIKSAVFVMLIDAETERTVKEEGVEFELYGLDHALQILNTYYPEKITYRKYDTTEEGTFYLPEKLFWGTYELHELTEPLGYDMGKNVKFTIDEMYDWPEPYVVHFPVYPSRNIVRVQMNDAETGVPLSGGSFEVIAAENILTMDGTMRYRAGQVVSEIVCDEEGYGESEEIYLGSYYLKQKDIPEYYAGLLEPIDVVVEKKSDVLPEVVQVDSERTKVHVKLVDELYDGRGIGSVVYAVSAGRDAKDAFEAVTDSKGEFLLDELEKGVIYHIRQVSPAEDYQADSQDYAVMVGANGRIDGSTEMELVMKGRMIRVSIGITDEFSSVQVPGVNLALYKDDGTMIRTWTTSGSKVNFTNLEPGRYYIIRDGDMETRHEVEIVSQAAVQEINLKTSYTLMYIIIGASLALAAVLIIFLIVWLRRRRRKKKAQKEASDAAET